MKYHDLLQESAQRTKSIACVGLDPVLDRIPLDGEPEDVITKYCLGILNAFADDNCLPGAIKPNIAYYEQHGIAGLRALKRIVARCKELRVPVIIDAKRADIGASSQAYANALFDYWQADAVTVAPYMGHDSIQPFIREGKGTYVLCRTSNPGAQDLQDLNADGTPIFMHTAKFITKWEAGAVFGATYPKEMEGAARLFADHNTPLLIPGVGSQGGSAEQIVSILKAAEYDLSLCRINSSSGIMYAYEKEDTEDYTGAALRALKKLNAQIGFMV